MPFSQLDTATITRTLGQIAEGPDLADVYFERREDIELPPEDQSLGSRVWRETGLAVRLMREGRSWLAGRDAIDRDAFHDALRRAARTMPRGPLPQLDLTVEPWREAPDLQEVQEFPSLVRRAITRHKIDAAVRLTVRRHRRWSRVLGTRLASATEHESFYSLVVEMPWGRTGGLLTELGDAAAETVAQNITRAHDARDAPSPDSRRTVCVLGSAATAVLLHEAVAHALEADHLALTGHPEAAIGITLGSAALNVFDDPAGAPKGVRRSADDEGFPVVRRCLLRGGIVEQPLCDTHFARSSERLTAGAGRRGNRHLAPTPRSTHLELAAGELATQDLLAEAEGGLYLPEAERGHLDPLTGEFFLHFPHGRRISNQLPGESVGPSVLKGRISDLLSKVVGVGRDLLPAGAGWCAKGGAKVPVWATVPEVRLEGVEVRP